MSFIVLFHQILSDFTCAAFLGTAEKAHATWGFRLITNRLSPGGGRFGWGEPPVTLHAAQHLRFLPKNFMLCYFFHVIICYNYVLFHDYSGRFSVPASSKSHFWAAARSAQSWICGSSRAGFGQPMATNHPPVSQKTSQKRENICKFIDPSMIYRSIENIFDRLPKNVWCFLLMNSMNYFRRLYPCESSQVFQVHCTCCTPWVKTKGCEKPPIKSETMKVQFCSSRVAPETCQEFVKWAKVICLQWAIDCGNRFNQMIAALQTETGYSNLLSLDKSIATLLSLGILLHPSSLSHKWTVLFLSPVFPQNYKNKITLANKKELPYLWSMESFSLVPGELKPSATSRCWETICHQSSAVERRQQPIQFSSATDNFGFHFTF